MDKALNQLSVPLGQLREEVLVKCFSAAVFPAVEMSLLFCCCCCCGVGSCCLHFSQSLRSSVNEVIQAIDTQLTKQDDIQKKKVCRFIYLLFSLIMIQINM